MLQSDYFVSGAAGAVVPSNSEQLYHPGRSRQLAAYRPMAEELKHYISALSGPKERPPLIYSGDPQASLDSLHHDVVSHYRQLSTALGEHERSDLTSDPPPLLSSGLSYGRLSLGSPPDPVLRLPAATSGKPYLALSSPIPNVISSRLRLHGYNGSGVASTSPYSALQGVGFRPTAGSAPTGLAWETGGGIRASSFALGPVGTSDPDSLMLHEESRLLYPPVGSTFDGHASRTVMAARSPGGGFGLDTFQYRRPRPLQYGDMLQESTSTGIAPCSQMRSERDQLDAFLSEFASGRIQTLVPQNTWGLPAPRQYR